jgi:Zn-dependent protease with chaperone function
MIEDIVSQVGSKFPKKIYLSSEVNASVFYDSSFWSMFFPVKKNLLIGIGLVNMTAKDELKAILSHEFGHFSQKTMKVGSYVYNVNQVIFNMLYDNDAYDNLIQKWAEVSGYLSIFVFIAVKIVHFIQKVLQVMYNLINKSYMGLSREMEFHADEIASHVTGYLPLKTSLLRAELASHAFNSVLSFYESKVSKNIRSKNVYKEQRYIANFLAVEMNIPIVNGFPNITLEEVSRFNKSKLIIKDQWSSHPTNEERIAKLEEKSIVIDMIDETPAREIFRDTEKLEESVTNMLFSNVNYEQKPTEITLDLFKKDFEKEYTDNIFSKEYNNYYDNHNPLNFDLDEIISLEKSVDFEKLYSEKKVELNDTILALKSDIETLNLIKNKSINIKTFDYDGVKYSRKKVGKLIGDLELEVKDLTKKSQLNDVRIYSFFVKKSTGPRLKELYSNFFSFDKEYDKKIEAYTELSSKLEFINYQLSVDEIQSKILLVEAAEVKFKRCLKELIEDERFQSEISSEMKKSFDSYLAEKLKYFGKQMYFEENLQILFLALNNYASLVSRGYFITKRELLNYQLSLLKR